MADNCTVCGIKGSHKGHTDDDMQDIYLETIYWYMLAEVNNRDYSEVLQINRVQQLNASVKG
jgi:hypothetical protein